MCADLHTSRDECALDVRMNYHLPFNVAAMQAPACNRRKMLSFV